MGNSLSNYYTMRDLDGCMVGSQGYVVANNRGILPPDSLLSCRYGCGARHCGLVTAGICSCCPTRCYREGICVGVSSCHGGTD